MDQVVIHRLELQIFTIGGFYLYVYFYNNQKWVASTLDWFYVDKASSTDWYDGGILYPGFILGAYFVTSE